MLHPLSRFFGHFPKAPSSSPRSELTAADPPASCVRQIASEPRLSTVASSPSHKAGIHGQTRPVLQKSLCTPTSLSQVSISHPRIRRRKVVNQLLCAGCGRRFRRRRSWPGNRLGQEDSPQSAALHIFLAFQLNLVLGRESILSAG